LHDELVLQSAASFFAPPSGAPARSHPTTYVLCTDDWAIPPAAQEAMSAAADSAVGLQSAHVLQLSHPEVLADVLAGMLRRLWWPTGRLTTAHLRGRASRRHQPIRCAAARPRCFLCL
jgi:hypothetical protein